MKAYPIPKNLNILLSVAAYTAAITCLKLASGSSALWQLCLYAVLFSFVNSTIFFLMHESVHGIFHPNPKINDFFGSLSGAFFPISFQMQRIYHLGHHRRNRSRPELFDYYDVNDSKLRKTIEYNCIINGVFWLFTSASCLAYLLRPGLFTEKSPMAKTASSRAMILDFNGKENRRVIVLEILFCFLLHGTLVALLRLKLWPVFLCYWAFGMNWGALQYVFHAWAPRDVRNGAFNMKLHPLLRLIYLNFPYHLAHHQHPRLPWIHLGSFVKDPSHLPSMTMHYLKMWTGPRPIEGQEAAPVDQALADEIYLHIKKGQAVEACPSRA